MDAFTYEKPTTIARALAAAKADGAHVLAGGTTLIDLMRLGVVRATAVVDVGGLGLPLSTIGPAPSTAATGKAAAAGVRIGALARNSEVAAHELIAKGYPALAEAILAGGSPQIRGMATVGGNLMQRTRCPYFRDLAHACNKRNPGVGCAAATGVTRSLAVLGATDTCSATHASDMCVALLALDATVLVRGAPTGPERAIAIGDFHTLPGAHPELETALQPGELIVAVELPASAFAARSHYVKVADGTAQSFALASAAVALELAGRTIKSARIALGGVATKPWRALDAEKILVGRTISVPLFAQAAAAATTGAVARGDNAFKIPLVQRVVVRALAEVAGLPSS